MAVVGGGPTGLETAGALAELTKHVFHKDYPELDTGKMKVWLIEAGPELLSAMSAKSRKAAERFIRQLGVNLLLNVSVRNYDGTSLRLSNGETITCNTVIWSAGVTGNILTSFPPEMTEKGRIKTDDCNRVAGADNCFALGDVAGISSAVIPRGYPMLAPVAKQQGKQLAKNLERLLEGKSMVPFHYTDKGTMATVGRAKAVLDFNKLHLHGFIAWIGWLFIHLMYLVGFRNKVIVLVNWMWNYIRYDSAIRLIIRPYKRKM
jgi:NADH dehydrogenase